MTKDQRDLIGAVTDLARTRGLDVRVDKSRGKGSHLRVYVGSRVTTVPAKIKTGMRRAILKQLDLE